MLRARLFLNWIPFVVILVGVGAYAIVLFSRLANDVDVTVMKNYRSAIAAESMGRAMSRMETGLHLVMEDQRISGTSMFDENTRVFEEQLGVLITNRHLFDGTKLIEQLQSNYQSFRAGAALLRHAQPREQAGIFTRDVVPRLFAIYGSLEQTGKLNHAKILATSQNIQDITRHITRLMIAVLAAALLVSIFFSFPLARAILKPIQSLTKATREIGEGNLDQIIPVVSQDELGELAAAFNKMAAQLKVYRDSTSEQIVRLHHTMEAALASFPDPIFILDRAGHIELKNPAAEALAAKLGLGDALPARLPETAGEVLRTGKDFLPHSFTEVLSFRVDGEERAFLPRILTMHGGKEQAVGVAVVLQDVTRFRLLDDAKTNLVATVSHELKTPLTSVRMALHLLSEKTVGPLTRKQTDLVETARKEAERLLRILNDLLDLTRLEAGQSGLNNERVTPAALVQTIFDEAQRGVVEQGCKLSRDIQPQLPRVWVDPQRIGHVFHNFIRNAIRHSPPHGEVRLRASRTEDGGVQFSVTDQGPGVPEEYVNHIFDRFFRVPGQTKAGAGLGLSIAREIVVAHGGRIGVRSEPGQGSEFYFVLAAVEEEAPIPASLTSHPPSVS